MNWFNNKNKIYSILSVFIATFPIMRPQISAYFIGFWAVISISVFFTNRNYLNVKRNDIKKSEAYESGYLQRTTPSYKSYMTLKKSMSE